MRLVDHRIMPRRPFKLCSCHSKFTFQRFTSIVVEDSQSVDSKVTARAAGLDKQVSAGAGLGSVSRSCSLIVDLQVSAGAELGLTELESELDS